MKKLPFYERPHFAKRILEVGGGHNPYDGVTHAVDKYPADNSQRAGSMVLGKNVEFKVGELEAIPFQEPKFDFMYASHVFEHVSLPQSAIAEMNRVAKKGYVETPSPLREQVVTRVPYDRANDIHTAFCWKSASTKNTLHFIKKSDSTVGEFCECRDGRLAQFLVRFAQEGPPMMIESCLPGSAKTTRLFFKSPLFGIEHESFRAACEKGACGYQNVRAVRFWTSPLLSWTSKRFKNLREILDSK